MTHDVSVSEVALRFYLWGCMERGVLNQREVTLAWPFKEKASDPEGKRTRGQIIAAGVAPTDFDNLKAVLTGEQSVDDFDRTALANTALSVMVRAGALASAERRQQMIELAEDRRKIKRQAAAPAPKLGLAGQEVAVEAALVEISALVYNYKRS